jgi:pSer/pThr/pTyr-binding forkhead associated (FHA) protein
MSEHFILKRLADGAETPITEPLLAGRHPECGLLLPDGGAEGGPSRRHAQISVDDGTLWVEDLDSKNGTFVNGTRLVARQRTQLHTGDRLRFDRVEFVVQAPEVLDATKVRPLPPVEARVVRDSAPERKDQAAGAAPAAPRSAPPERPAEARAAVPATPAGAAPRVAAPATPPASARVAGPAPPTEQMAATPPAQGRAGDERAPRVATPATPPPAAGSATPQNPPAKPAMVMPPSGAPARSPAASSQESSGERTPGSWADPDAQREGKTVFIDPRNVRKLLEESAGSAAGSAGLASGQVSVPTLSVTSGALTGGRFELRAQRGETNEWTIGSNGDRNIVLSGEGVSGEHARIVNEGERWKVIDQLSRYGTFVNGRRTPSSFLSSGDTVGFGPAVACLFQLPGGSRRKPVAADRAAPEQPRRGSRIDVVTLLVSFLVTAAVILLLWRFLPVLKQHILK